MILATTSAAIAMVISLQAASAEPQPAAAPAEQPQAQPAETAATATTEEKITDRSHPDYIRCRRDSVIGSRARKVKRCFTNREWDEIARVGNGGARTMVGDLQPGIYQPGS